MDNNIYKMLTKDQIKIMQVFVSKITQSFTIRGVAKTLKKDHAQIHKAIQPLIKVLLNQTQEKRLVLNYKENSEELAYIEYLRTKEFLTTPKNKTLKFFINDVMKVIKDEYFIMILFGSVVKTNNPRDIDVFVIVDNLNKIDSTDRFLGNIASRYSLKFDINVVSVESIYEMAGHRDEKNVLNELLNKHLIIYGGENFYKLLKNARR